MLIVAEQMIVTLSMTTFSGLKLYAVEEGKGPLAGNISLSMISTAYAHDDDYEEDKDESIWEEVHELGVNLMLLLIVLHVAGVAYSSRAHAESLVKAMINGYKKGEER